MQGPGETGFPHIPCGSGPEARAPRPRPLGGSGRAQPSRRGPGKPGFPTSPAEAGRRPAHPGPGPWEGLGGRSPHAGVRGNRVSPHLLRKRAGGPRTRAPAPGRVWEGAALTQGSGETGFPHISCGSGPEARAPRPRSLGGSGRAQPSRRGLGKPGFPGLSSRGRVWEGAALTQGCGETGFPHIPCGSGPEARAPRPRPLGGSGRAQPSRRGLGKPGFPGLSSRGRVWEGQALPGTTVGASHGGGGAAVCTTPAMLESDSEGAPQARPQSRSNQGSSASQKASGVSSKGQ